MPDSASNSVHLKKKFAEQLIPSSFYTIFREERTFLAVIGLAVSFALAVSINLKIEANIVNFISWMMFKTNLELAKGV